MGHAEDPKPMKERYGSKTDIEVCRRIHKRFGTTYYYSTLRFPDRIRWRVHGLYAFVRVPDEWVDNPDGLSIAERRAKLEEWRTMMVRGLGGERPDHPAMRVFCDVVRDCGMPVEEAHCFLDAMAMDLEKDRYETYEDLRAYMRGSASAIGVMMCHAMGADLQADTIGRAKALGEAMQLTNFLRDIAEDYRERRRIYLPEEDMRRFGVTEEDVAEGRMTDNFRRLMRFEIDRARELYAFSDPGICLLPAEGRKAVLLARLLYSQILDRIEAQNLDVFAGRARTTLAQKLVCAARVALTSNKILERLTRGHTVAGAHVGRE